MQWGNIKGSKWESANKAAPTSSMNSINQRQRNRTLIILSYLATNCPPIVLCSYWLSLSLSLSWLAFPLDFIFRKPSHFEIINSAILKNAGDSFGPLCNSFSSFILFEYLIKLLGLYFICSIFIRFIMVVGIISVVIGVEMFLI